MTSSSSPDSNLLDIWDKLPGLRFSFRGSVDGLLGLCILWCIRTGANHTRAGDRGSAVKIENIWALLTKELSVPYRTQILLIPENFKIIDLFSDSVSDDKHMKHVRHLKREFNSVNSISLSYYMWVWHKSGNLQVKSFWNYDSFS